MDRHRFYIAQCLIIIAFAVNIEANAVPIITEVREFLTDSSIVIEYEVFDADDDSLSYRLAFGGEEIDLTRENVALSDNRIEIPLELVSNKNLPPHILAYDGEGYGGEYIEVAPAKRARALVGRFEITNLEFAAFVEVGGYETERFWIVDDGSISVPKMGWRYQGKFGWLSPAGWRHFDEPAWASDTVATGAFHPVVGVSWWECWAFCKWAGVELPTIEQWEAAADKTTGGSDILVVKGNFAGDGDGYESLAPGGSYPSPHFADLAGNVWEWLSNVRDVIDYAEFTCAARALVGGSWQSPSDAFPDYRRSECPLLRDPDVGFRVVAAQFPEED